jgi:hypothetical protein
MLVTQDPDRTPPVQRSRDESVVSEGTTLNQPLAPICGGPPGMTRREAERSCEYQAPGRDAVG